MPPKPADERWQILALELSDRMSQLGVSPPMLARRAGVEVKRVRALLAGQRPQSPIGEIPLTRMAEALAVQPWILMGRLDGSTDEPLTSTGSTAAPPPVADGPAARIAVLVPRLDERDQLMIERFVLRLLGQ